MNGRTLRRAGATFVVLASLTSAYPAGAADDARKKEAQSLFEMALKQAEAGDNAAALSTFRSAYEKYPNFRVQYNIGKVCARMGDTPCAVRALEAYLSEGGAEIPAKRKKEVEGEIKALSRTLSTITVKSSVAGADVTIDEVVVGKTPLSAPIPVRGGSHKVSLVTETGKVTEKVTVLAGQNAEVSLTPKEAKKDEPKKEEPPPPAAAPPSVPDPQDTKEPESPGDAAKTDRDRKEEPRAFPVVPWAIAGGLAGATILTGILAATSYSSYKDKKGEYPLSREDLDSAQESARNLFLLSTAFGAGTVIAAGVATYFTFWGSSSSGSGPPPSKARVTGLNVGPGGIAITGVMP